MKFLTYLLIIFFIFGCASTTYTPAGQKKAAFNPKMDTDCKSDSSVGTGYNLAFTCANDNGLQFIKHTVMSKYKMSKSDMLQRANKFCELSDRKAIYKGKANIAFMSKLDWHGEEYICQ